MKRFLTLSVLGAALAAGCLFSNSVSARNVPPTRDAVQLSFAPLVKQVAPAVVNIHTKRTVTRSVNPFMNDPFFSQFFGHMGAFGGGGLSRQQVESALGSGVIVSEDGYIITNAHVIRDAQEIKIVLPDGREFDAEKKLVDAPSDLAVLKVTGNAPRLPFVHFKPSETLQVGDLVLAIGNPFGVGQTVTSGIVSALARSSLNISDFNFFIQTDAAINPGNSGGPLVAMDGSVIGINTAIFSQSGGSLGIGFAIPSEMVTSVLTAARSGKGGEQGVARAWLGIKAQRVTSDIADSLGFDAPNGVLIVDLHKASPLGRAGMKTGDVIVTMNGRDLRDPSEMKFRMATVPLGDHAEFEVLRQGKRHKMRVVAMEAPDDPPATPTVLRGAHALDGAVVSNINPAIAERLDLRRDNGVVISQIQQGSAARFAREGDVVVEINGVAVTDVAQLQSILTRGGAGWNIILEQNGQRRQVMIR